MLQLIIRPFQVVIMFLALARITYWLRQILTNICTAHVQFCFNRHLLDS